VKTAAERFVWLAALAAVVFFARWELVGLQPDAALYAGLSLKVLRTGEAWLLAGTEGRFPEYFEHPPYFFQWGARVLARLGTSDGAARAIGAIPGVVAFLSMLVWTWRRFSWTAAFTCALMLATYGRYTKFAATSMLEGPLSLGVSWTAIASFELHWKSTTGWRRPFLWTLLVAGLLLSTATKGVAGLGAWGGLALSLGLALAFSERPVWKILHAGLFVWVWLVVALAPFAHWALNLFERDGISWILDYAQKQVFTSLVSNRGDITHTVDGDRLFFLKRIVLDDGWPWWWTVPAGWIGAAVLRVRGIESARWAPLKSPLYRSWSLHAGAFFLAFVVPFSLARFQLGHYLHPLYLPLAPCGAVALAAALGPRFERFGARAWPRWVLVAVAGLVLFFSARGVTGQQNRGQPFFLLREGLASVRPECRVLVAADKMDAYRMESYALWYWEARPWELIERAPSSKGAVPSGAVYWNPEDGTFWPAPDCGRRSK
jgi:4-amino-4-deoxy-L-arabinose transferase-like glycosyltransferase